MVPEFILEQLEVKNVLGKDPQTPEEDQEGGHTPPGPTPMNAVGIRGSHIQWLLHGLCEIVPPPCCKFLHPPL